MRRLCKVLLILGVAVLLAAPALAQRQRSQQGQRGRFGGGLGGAAMLLQNEGVQKELKLDQDQIDKTKAAVQKVQEKHRDAFAKLRESQSEEAREKMVALSRTVSEETYQAVADILKPDQVKRLKQIELQQAGARAFARPDVQKALNLNDEQKEKIKTIGDDAAKQMRELFQGGNVEGAREKLATLRKETTERIQAVLTDVQKKTWKELTGEPFQVRFEPRRRSQ